MSIVLFRVDERLIHGQVVIGWGNQLRPDRYLVVDEKLALSDWEQDLYRLGAASVDVQFVTPEVARENLDAWRLDTARSILLTKEVPTMGRLAEGGLLIGEKVNLGGIHHGPGREEFLTYLHLTEDDISELLNGASSVLVLMGEDSVLEAQVRDAIDFLRANERKGYVVPHRIEDLRPTLDAMRQFKSTQELAVMREAARISSDAFKRIMKFCKPGAMEYQLEAELQHEFAMQGAPAPFFASKFSF